MGFACLTWLEAIEGNRPKVGRKYSIDRDVLQTLGRLTSTVGDAQSARKFEHNHNPRTHTPTERMWVEAAIRALTLRVGQWAADPERPLPKITMADLPKLVK